MAKLFSAPAYNLALPRCDSIKMVRNLHTHALQVVVRAADASKAATDAAAAAVDKAKGVASAAADKATAAAKDAASKLKGAISSATLDVDIRKLRECLPVGLPASVMVGLDCCCNLMAASTAAVHGAAPRHANNSPPS